MLLKGIKESKGDRQDDARARVCRVARPADRVGQPEPAHARGPPRRDKDARGRQRRVHRGDTREVDEARGHNVP